MTATVINAVVTYHPVMDPFHGNLENISQRVFQEYRLSKSWIKRSKQDRVACTGLQFDHHIRHISHHFLNLSNKFVGMLRQR